MGTKYKEVGGSASGKAVSDQYANFLSQMLSSGSVGRPAGGGAMTGTAGGLGGFYSNLLSGGALPRIGDINLNLDSSVLDPTKAQAAYSNLFNQQQGQAINDLRARFGTGGGLAYGTPAAFAESQYRAAAAPQLALGLENIQQSRAKLLQASQGLALTQRGQDLNYNVAGLQAQLGGADELMRALSQVYGINTPQAAIQKTQGLFGQIASGLGAIAAPVASIFAPGLGKGGGGGGGGTDYLAPPPLASTPISYDPISTQPLPYLQPQLPGMSNP